MSTTHKAIHLYSVGTANGNAVGVAFEEIKAINPALDYSWEYIDIFKNTQKEPWFIKLNPNGRLPVIIDHTSDDFVVMETSAILLYVAQKFDTEHRFWFDPVKEPQDYSTMLQWLFFAHGGIGPMQGQAHHFHFLGLNPEADIPYGRKRYTDEVKRLYGVLELRLKDRDYLAGPGRGKFTLADIKAFPWPRVHHYAEIDNLDEWPNMKAWIERCESRPGAKAGFEVAKIVIVRPPPTDSEKA